MSNNLFIIGGGPSLKGFDFSKLKNKDTLVINRSILDVPKPNYFITMDYTFYDKIDQKTNNQMSKTDFQTHPCHKVFVIATNNDYITKIKGDYIDTRYDYRYILNAFDEHIPANRSLGVGFSKEQFVHGCCSGFAALQYGLLLDYDNIYLLGIDLFCEDNDTHYHDDYHFNLNKFNDRLKFYYPYFAEGVKEAKEMFSNKNIYSCSYMSILNNHLDYKPLQEVL